MGFLVIGTLFVLSCSLYFASSYVAKTHGPGMLRKLRWLWPIIMASVFTSAIVMLFTLGLAFLISKFLS